MDYKITDTFTVTKIYPRESNLPVDIYAHIELKKNKGQTVLTVSNITERGFSGDSFALSISDNPEIIGGECKLKPAELDIIKNWIILYKGPLMSHWNQEIDSKDLLDELNIDSSRLAFLPLPPDN